MLKYTVLVLMLGLSSAHAATELSMLCDSGTTTGARLNACVTLEWAVPQPESFVASCLSTCTWTSADSAWRKFSELPSGAKWLRCSADITPASFTAGVPGVDPCPDGAKHWAADSNQITRTARWLAPTTNTDGTVLTDLAGYRLSVAESEAGPWRLVAVPGASASAMVVPVAVTAVERCAQLVARTGAGQESAPKTACLQAAPPMSGENFTFE